MTADLTSVLGLEIVESARQGGVSRNWHLKLYRQTSYRLPNKEAQQPVTASVGTADRIETNSVTGTALDGRCAVWPLGQAPTCESWAVAQQATAVQAERTPRVTGSGRW
jgi:hypothetical protein